jgi:hypothetical protein
MAPHTWRTATIHRSVGWLGLFRPVADVWSRPVLRELVDAVGDVFVVEGDGMGVMPERGGQISLPEATGSAVQRRRSPHKSAARVRSNSCFARVGAKNSLLRGTSRMPIAGIGSTAAARSGSRLSGQGC